MLTRGFVVQISSRWSSLLAASLLASLIGLPAGPAAAQAPAASGDLSSYHKKQVAILEPSDGVLYQMLAQKFIDQARFDYVQLQYDNDPAVPDVGSFLAAFADYLKTHAAAMAPASATTPARFGGVVVSRRQIAQVLGSSYVILPTEFVSIMHVV